MKDKNHIVIEVDPDVCALDSWKDLNLTHEFPHPLIVCDYVSGRLVQVSIVGPVAVRLNEAIEALVKIK